MSFTKFSILFQKLFMKLLISSKLCIFCMSTINLTSLRLDSSIQFVDTSSVVIGLELVFGNLFSTISENLLFFWSFKENDLLIFLSRDLFFFCCVNLANKVHARVSPFLRERQTGTDLATNFLQKSDKLVYGPLVLLAPE